MMTAPNPVPPAVPGPLVVAVLAPRGRDAELVGHALQETGLEVHAVADLNALCGALDRPDLGAVVLTAEALQMPGLQAVAAALTDEPEWSEVPFVLFVDGGWTTQDYLALMEALGGRHNVTVLERPIRPVAFRSVVEMAVEGRRQQIRVRDLLAQVQGFNEELRARVAVGAGRPHHSIRASRRRPADGLVVTAPVPGAPPCSDTGDAPGSSGTLRRSPTSEPQSCPKNVMSRRSRRSNSAWRIHSTWRA